MWILGCIPLGCSGSGSVIWYLHSDHGTSNEPMNPFPDWIAVVEITVGHRTLSDQNAVNVRLILQWEMRDERKYLHNRTNDDCLRLKLAVNHKEQDILSVEY